MRDTVGRHGCSNLLPKSETSCIIQYLATYWLLKPYWLFLIFSFFSFFYCSVVLHVRFHCNNNYDVHSSILWNLWFMYCKDLYIKAMAIIGKSTGNQSSLLVDGNVSAESGHIEIYLSLKWNTTFILVLHFGITIGLSIFWTALMIMGPDRTYRASRFIFSSFFFNFSVCPVW